MTVTKAVHVRGLTIELPGGVVLVEGAQLDVEFGQVVSLLGPSGSGKSTLLGAVLSPERSRSEGLRVQWIAREVSESRATIPQRGALLDYLDVRSNVALAQAGNQRPIHPESWLRAVDLDAGVTFPGRTVESLSGGEAQRVAVARVLAAGCKLIVMDEPSSGLDVANVRTLARLLIKQAREQRAAIIVVTHDLTLAGGASDKIVFLDPERRSLEEVPWSKPAESEAPSYRHGRIATLEASIEKLMVASRNGGAKATSRAAAPRTTARMVRDTFVAPLHTAGSAFYHAWSSRLRAESSVVFRRTLRESLTRPALFYAAVGGLLGFTVPFVIANISRDLRAAAIFELIKGTYILSLAPPLSAIVFAATSGSAVSAWVGGLSLQGQVTALRGVGVPPSRYLWSPTWLALALAYLGAVGLFTAAMVVGGWLLYRSEHVEHAFRLLTVDFVEPPPSRYPYLLRGLWSVLAYALTIPSIAVAKGREQKRTAADVTAAMTSSVMRTTLAVVILELLSVVVLRRWGL